MEIELSIIVPVYNVEQYLEECLDSIYAVENIKKEVILVNDGSTDGSLEILKRYKNKYSDITVLIEKENGGLSSARNAGIRVAKGEYLSFIDSDDWIDSKKYKEFFKEGQKFNLDIMVSGPILYTKGKILEKDWYLLLDKKYVYTGKEFLESRYSKRIYKVEVWDDIYKRDLILKNNIYFKEKLLHEDELFTPLIQLKADRIKIVDKNYYYYRQREGSIVKTRNIKNEISCMYIFLYLLLKREFQEREFKRFHFWMYQDSFSRANILYLKEHFKILFLPNLTFKDRLWLIKVLKYVKEVKWSIEKEI